MSLVARNVSARAGGRELLAGVSLEVSPGTITALLGPNGAGKSTLLSVLAGDLTPDIGEVTLDGTPLGCWPAAALARRRAVMPQADHLVFPFPAREVVAFGRSPHTGADPATETALVDDMLARVGAAALAERPYTVLSGGERRRVQLARVLIQAWGDTAAPPGLVLLDEHTAHLDPGFQHSTCRLLREGAARGMGVLVVMHDVNLALDYADRIACLREGRLVFEGEADEARSPALLERVFGVPFSAAGEGAVRVAPPNTRG